MKKIISIIAVALIIIISNIIIIFPILTSKSVIIYFAIHPFDIAQTNANIWNSLKILYIIFLCLSAFSISYITINLLINSLTLSNSSHSSNSAFRLFDINSNEHVINPKGSKSNSKSQLKNSELSLSIGISKKNQIPIVLPEKALYQNFLITGTIGSGKTSSAIYPFLNQLVKYKSSNPKEKLGILCLDVKGNFYKQVKIYAQKYGREKDLVIIGLDHQNTYNPLDKPVLNPLVLANRLKTILSILSPNNSESFWLDKAEQILAEAIKLCRLYNSYYVNFVEIHKLINDKNYYYEKINILKEKFLNNSFSTEEIFTLHSAISFFENEFFSLDERTISILKSEITRITLPFISDYRISKLFSPKKENINFKGFKSLLNSGKIVVLSMNISEFNNLSKIIATYMKLDFQAEIMQSLKINNRRPVAFICDEFQEYITTSDANFFSESREAKCINIIATQSYSSLLNALKDESALKVILQNLVNKLWFRTDDLFTIESAQKQLGKEDKEKLSKTISENAQESNYNYLINKFKSNRSSLSESINTYTQFDYIYDSKFFSQEIQTFTALAFLSNGLKALEPELLEMKPYFKQ